MQLTLLLIKRNSFVPYSIHRQHCPVLETIMKELPFIYGNWELSSRRAGSILEIADEEFSFGLKMNISEKQCNWTASVALPSCYSTASLFISKNPQMLSSVCWVPES